MKVLVVDDDPVLCCAVEGILERHGHVVDLAGTVAAGTAALDVYAYDAVVLDVGLPDGSGLAIAQDIRSRGLDVPVLVLSSYDDVDDEIRGLDAGADDYLAKPVVPDRLVARIRALLRRGGARTGDALSCGTLVLSRQTREVAVAGHPVALSPKEYGILEQLLAAAGGVVSRDRLRDCVWEQNADPDSNVVDVIVGRLRAKLARAGATAQIRTARGVGFRILVPDADEGRAPAGAAGFGRSEGRP